ncbi:NrtA/SsuA/CpmA family ABC transporter substrate-binding protein [Haloactinopolyspora sp.]|uniref:ABC transporter substrate-binding protein n=1 Tax=Haloactinopolyspora sp. TaxID=1966353 RepID=UPI002611600C|nr:NrtA/SsuA/CpmA family ABC transporter substrate-binding protein [Haloactinopolyspora sp.]
MATRSRVTRLLIAAPALLLMAGCGGGATVDDDVAGGGDGDGDGGGASTELTSVRAGYVSAIDQIGLPVAVETGYFEDEGLDVELAQPFPTGVDVLNALQSGEVDIVQVGTPMISAAQKGDDLVLLGNYTGSASQGNIDETMGVVAKASSGVSGTDLSTLAGKRIGVSIGSINHLYLLGLLDDAGLDVSDVEIVNTAPPDMAVALETDGIDVGIIWDPWPIQAVKQVEGAEEILRGGGYIPFIGYQITTREFAAENPEIIKSYLTARAAVDQWMRENPDDAAESATRWLPGTEVDVATEAMKYNITQLDPRLSQCNVLALDTVSQLLAEQDAVEPGFDAAAYFDPAPILDVMEDRPELFEDLPPIPDGAELTGSDVTYDRAAAEQACA